MFLVQLRPLAPLDGQHFHLRFHAKLDEIPDRRQRLLHDLLDRGIVENRSGCLPYVTCAEPKQEEIVDKQLVHSHAKLL